MPLRAHLPAGAFGPDEIATIAVAFDDVLRDLRLVDRTDPLIQLIAKRVIEIALEGEQDAAQLSCRVLTEFRPPQSS
jgi:hypothetical protein